MNEVELFGGPADGLRMRVRLDTPYLKIPVDLGRQPIAWTATTTADPARIPVATYIRCDHVNGRVSYRYRGQEWM